MMDVVLTHLPILPIALPLLAAGLVLVLGETNRAAQRIICWMTVALLLVCGVLAVNETAQGKQLIYLVGNWRAPFGIALAIDKLTAMMLLLTAIIATAVLLAAQHKPGEHFFSLFMLQLMGLNGAFLTIDLFNLFVFFEVLLAASYGMLLQHTNRQRTNAATHYVVINLLGSALFLIAVSLLYAITGTLNMADLSQRLSAVTPASQALAAVAGFLLVVVFAIKAALLPLNFWLTTTYRAAILPVAALFALMTKVGVVALARTTTLIFPEGGAVNAHISQALLLVAPITMLLAAAGALAARDVRTLIGWSVVGSAGMLITALAVGNVKALAGALFYLAGSTIATAMLFLNTAALDETSARVSVGSEPPGKQWAWTGALFFVGAAAMVGLPPFAGFIGKATILAGAGVHTSQVWVWSVILIAGLMSMFAYARMGSRVFWKTDATTVAINHQPAAILLGLVLVGLTVFAAPIQRYTDQAAVEVKRPQFLISNVLGKLPQQKPTPPPPNANPVVPK